MTTLAVETAVLRRATSRASAAIKARIVASSSFSEVARTGMSLPVASTRLATSAKVRYLLSPRPSTMSIGWLARKLSSSSEFSGRCGRIAMPPLRSMLISCSASSNWSSTRRSRMTASCGI